MRSISTGVKALTLFILQITSKETTTIVVTNSFVRIYILCKYVSPMNLPFL